MYAIYANIYHQINIPQMIAYVYIYIPYMDPMGNDEQHEPRPQSDSCLYFHNHSSAVAVKSLEFIIGNIQISS